MAELPARTEPQLRAVSAVTWLDGVDELERLVEAVDWFARVGEPSPWDAGSARLTSWDDWPGPEHPAVIAMALDSQAMYDALVGPAGSTTMSPTGWIPLADAAGRASNERNAWSRATPSSGTTTIR